MVSPAHGSPYSSMYTVVQCIVVYCTELMSCWSEQHYCIYCMLLYSVLHDCVYCTTVLSSMQHAVVLHATEYCTAVHCMHWASVDYSYLAPAQCSDRCMEWATSCPVELHLQCPVYTVVQCTVVACSSMQLSAAAAHQLTSVQLRDCYCREYTSELMSCCWGHYAVYAVMQLIHTVVQ